MVIQRSIAERDELVTNNYGLAIHFAGRDHWLAIRHGVEQDDMRQAALMGLIEAAARHDPERGPFATCAFLHCRNRLTQLLSRRRPAWQQVPVASDGTEIEQVAPADDTDVEGAVDLWGALGTLAPRDRRLLELRYGLTGEPELSLAETGEVLGISGERVRQIEIVALLALCEQLTP